LLPGPVFPSLSPSLLPLLHSTPPLPTPAALHRRSPAAALLLPPQTASAILHAASRSPAGSFPESPHPALPGSSPLLARCRTLLPASADPETTTSAAQTTMAALRFLPPARFPAA